MTTTTKKTTATDPLQLELTFRGSRKKQLRYPFCRVQITRLAEQGPLAQIITPESAAEYWLREVATQADYTIDQEQVVVVMLDTRLWAMGWQRCSLGSVNETVAKITDILRPPIIMGAPHLLLMHCHPSGDCSPSTADMKLTSDLNDAARLMGLKLQDHIIVPAGNPQAVGPKFFSFRAAALL